MTRGCAALTLLAACGRVGFEATAGDAGADGSVRAPSIVADFASGERGSLTFRRSTSATYIGADSVMRVAAPDEPRFDHHPVLGTPLGLLVEPASTNLIVYSEAIDREPEWFTNGAIAVLANGVRAPDGTTSAEVISDNDTASSARRGQIMTVPDSSLPYTFSVFLKAGSTNLATLGAEFLDGTQQIQLGMDVDLTLGEVIRAPAAGARAWGLVKYADGWYRAFITARNNSTGNVSAVLSLWGYFPDDTSTGTYFAWGAQTEQSEVATSYIPTPADATVAREADIARIDEIASVDLTEGTLLVDIELAHVRTEQQQPAACLVGMQAPQGVCIERDPVARTAMVVKHGSPAVSVIAGTQPWTAPDVRRLVLRWSPSDVALHETASAASAMLPLPGAPTFEYLGVGAGGTGALDGWVRRIESWPFALTTAELGVLGVQ